MVVNSYTSTLPPACIQGISVGVDNEGIGVGGTVGVGVDGRGLGVDSSKLVDVTRSVSPNDGVGGSSVAMVVGVELNWGKATDPQAGNRAKTMQATTRLLHTFAVYHKIHSGCLLY